MGGDIYTTVSKGLFFLLINGFGIIIFWSFFRLKMMRKDDEYKKVMKDFGLEKKEKDVVVSKGIGQQEDKKETRKPSTVLSRKTYYLPLAFFTVTSALISSIFIFPSSFIGQLYTEGATNNFMHNPFFLGMHFGLETIDHNLVDLQVNDYIRRSIATLAWAFMGAYLWSASNMVRRLSKSDITPILYYKASFRILFACGVALIFSFISNEISLLGDTTYSYSFVPAIAFVVGTLPERFFHYLLDIMKKIFSGSDVNNKELHLRHIEGMSDVHRERLWEEGIDNAQNLAQAGLIQLIIKTPFESRQILDWIGQAKLMCHVKDDLEKVNKLGIRSIYDFIALKETYNAKGLDNMNALQELGQSAGLTTPILAVVSEIANNDPGINNLKLFLDRVNGKDDDEEVNIGNTYQQD